MSRLRDGVARQGKALVRACCLGLGLGALSGMLLSCSPEPPKPQDLILISIDTLNQQALPAFNPDAGALPHFDHLAQRARRFSRARSTASWTLPAHSSLFTGLYPDRHGAIAGGRKVSPDARLLTECLKQQGFEAAAFTGGGFLHKKFGLDRGFDLYQDGSEALRRGETDELWRLKERRTGLAFERAIRFLAERPQNSEEPLFLFVHTYIVHDFFRAHRWARQRLPEFDDLNKRSYRKCLDGREDCSPEVWQRMRDLYRAEVEHIDERLGLLMEALEKAGYEDTALVVLLSDHGEGFAPEIERMHHGGRVHADVVTIPMLVAGPGVQPADDPTPVSLVDMLPTLAEVLGVAPECAPDVDGQSFAAALSGEAAPVGRRTFFAMEHSHWWKDGVKTKLNPVPEIPALTAAIRGDLWFVDGTAGEELYNMEQDPRQLDNLAPDAEAVAGFKTEVRERVVRRAPEFLREDDDELEKELRSLGYL
ncbi:MAG: sulfatase [Acidobacteriota bacterium]|nr:sulfatase [Acidobacteriota bacterium]